MENSINSNNAEFECFQNYSASEVFVQGIAGIVNQGDVAGIVKAQKLMFVTKIIILIDYANSNQYFILF